MINLLKKLLSPKKAYDNHMKIYGQVGHGMHLSTSTMGFSDQKQLREIYGDEKMDALLAMVSTHVSGFLKDNEHGQKLIAEYRKNNITK
jgi:hypothetical protein